jgi:hypothetical protein
LPRLGQQSLLKGHHFKVILEESFKKEKPEVRAQDCRWYEQIPTYCGGFIGLYQESPTVLQWYTPSRRKTARKILDAFPGSGLRLDDYYDGHEAVLYFPQEILKEVCEMAGARKKRQGRKLTEEEKEQLAERGRMALKNYRLKKEKHNASEHQEIHSGPEVG